MVIETSKFQKSFLIQLLQMCLVMMSHKMSRKTWGLACKQTLLSQQYILCQPIDSNSVTYHSNIFYMMQGLGLDQKEILQASMNDHQNPNDSLMNNHFRKGFSNFVCQTLCTKSINKSINQSSPQLQFPKSLPNSPTYLELTTPCKQKWNLYSGWGGFISPTSTLFWTCQLSINQGTNFYSTW